MLKLKPLNLGLVQCNPTRCAIKIEKEKDLIALSCDKFYGRSGALNTLPCRLFFFNLEILWMNQARMHHLVLIDVLRYAARASL